MTEGSASTAPAPPGRRLQLSQSLLWGVAVAVSATGLLVPTLRLWRADLRVPFRYQGDALFVSSMYKGVLDHGWYLRNNDLNAPFGQDFRDFPLGDNLHLVFGRLLAAVSSEFGVVVNLYFILTFPLVALAAWWGLRRLGVSQPVASVLGVLYSFLPYHFLQGLDHLFLAAYYVVPLAAILAIDVLRGEPLFEARASPNRGLLPRWVTRRTVLSVGSSILIASASSYYGAFTLVLVLFAAVFRGVRKRSLVSLVPGLCIVAILVATMVANTAPALFFQKDQGRNEQVAERAPYETELYSLKLTNLLLPSEYHRIGPLARTTQRYAKTFPLPSERTQALGIVGGAGLVWLLFASLRTLATDRPWGALDERQRHLSLLVLVTLLVATTGGLSSLLSLLAYSQVRAWNRTSIFLAFFALAAVGLLLDRAREWRRNSRRAQTTWWAGLAALLVVGLADQTSDHFVPRYSAQRAEYVSDEVFVTGLERRLPNRAMVYQLPYIPFPENGPVADSFDYDQLRGYLHSSTLRWSYGGFKGRPTADWQRQLARKPVATVVPALTAVGFDGIVVDRKAYTDGGQAVENDLASLLGQPSLVSRDGRHAFFGTARYAGRLRAQLGPDRLSDLRRATLLTPDVSFDRGFLPTQRTPGETQSWHWCKGSCLLRLSNPASRDVSFTLDFKLDAAEPNPSTVRMRLPGGIVRRVSVGDQVVAQTVTLRLRPGVNWVHFSSDAPPVEAEHATPVSFRVVDLFVTTDELTRITSRLTPPL